MLSVILCTHARPDYLGACLAGLAAQSRRDFELLVVDSASPPAAATAIAGLAARHGARLLRAEAPGLSLARNLGLAAARAPWVAYLDDDAVAEPGWAAALLARIAILPEAGAALGGAYPAGLGSAAAGLVAAGAARRAHHRGMGRLRGGRAGPAGGGGYLRRQYGFRRGTAARDRRLPGGAWPHRQPAALGRGGGGGGPTPRPRPPRLL
ncbi:glycosyltransferase family 2 protein [Siccirubricoccus sp. G192]|nr:glycosyltransferase family 2 protein [Siccirubricoccus sp. G192]